MEVWRDVILLMFSNKRWGNNESEWDRNVRILQINLEGRWERGFDFGMGVHFSLTFGNFLGPLHQILTLT